MQTKTLLDKISALTLTFALTLAAPLAAFAAPANEFTGAVSYDTNATSAASVATITFTPATALVDGDTIVVTIPDNFGAFGGLTAADVTAANTGGTFGVETFDATQKTISIPVTAAGTGSSQVTITVGATNKLTNPALEGQYAIHIATKTTATGVIVDTGYAIASIANTVSVLATIAEALILTINDVTLNLNADPSVNNGQDTTQKTVLSISSNAFGGFLIQATLADTAATANQLKGANHAAALTSNGGGDNYFRVASTVEAATGTDSLAGGTTVADTAFSGTTTVYTAAAAGAALKNDSDLDVNYDLNVDFTTPADTYAGTITYTAVPTF